MSWWGMFRGPGRQRRSRRVRPGARRAQRMCRLESLEPRQMLTISVVQPMGQLETQEDGPDTWIDLRTVFESDLDQSLTYELVANTNPTLAEATVEAWALRVRHAADQSGSARISVRARGQSDGQTAVDTLCLTTRPVNDWPVLRSGLPEITLSEGGTATLDLTAYFEDVEDAAEDLWYSACAFDASQLVNPIQQSRVEHGTLYLTASADMYGYAQYAISATDHANATVSATLFVYVEPVNDLPLARQMPDRSHRLPTTATSSPVVLDLWFQHICDGTTYPYFEDVEDGSYLSFSVSVDDPRVFQTPPTVDADSFLVYCPTSEPGFYGSAVVTITARDQEGAVARLADGRLPTFRIQVDNRGVGYGPTPPPLCPPGPCPPGPASAATATVAGTGTSEPVESPAVTPLVSLPLSPTYSAGVDLQVLFPRIAEADETSPGALVALNDDFDEGNLGTTTILVGPYQREVQVLTKVPDNQPVRIGQQGRQHAIRTKWQWWWKDLSGDPSVAWCDHEVRLAQAVVTGPGRLQFDVPAGIRLWIPATALYGSQAFTHNPNIARHGTRWIEVRPGQDYRVDDPNAASFGAALGTTVPLAIEGVATAAGDIVARFTPIGTSQAVCDTVRVTVVSVDLDIDSDNSNGLQLPDRSAAEDLLEDQARYGGKRLVVNADDADRDNVPDLLDGFNLDARTGPGPATPADDQVDLAPGVGFVPLVVELPSNIDFEQALVRFHYSASIPEHATIAADHSRTIAPGGLRLWTVDEHVPRSPSAIDDPAGPGHFIAPGLLAPSSGYVDPAIADGTYTVSQLSGDAADGQFTIYLEGVETGLYEISIEVDADGVVLDNRTGRGLFGGVCVRDSVWVSVESEVTVSVVNAVGAESSNTEQVDTVQFEVSRGQYGERYPTIVFYRLYTESSTLGTATDPSVDGARADYWVSHRSAVSYTGLCDDPYTQIGWTVIPSYSHSATITVVPTDDAEVEWDESVGIELLEWDEYRALHDQILHATPNDGLPLGRGLPLLTVYKSFYRLKVDAQQQVVGHTAQATLLDNDALACRVVQRPDAEMVQESVAAIRQGLLDVALHDGTAQIVLPEWGPTYRESDQLLPLAELVLQLPASDQPISRLTGLYTVAGYAGETVEFAVDNLPSYLDANPLRELRLIVIGPAALSGKLTTGHYDGDVVLTAYTDDTAFTRTVRASLEVINRVDGALGSNEFGNRWWLDELDCVVPGDGITGPGPTAVSRLGPVGARTEAGIALVRGDHTTTWFVAPKVAPGAVVEIDDARAGRVTFSDPVYWVGKSGEKSPVVVSAPPYRSSAAGLEQREVYVGWHFPDLQPGHMYQLYVDWDAAPHHASNAVYTIHGAQPVAGGTTTVCVDQRFVPGEQGMAGRSWRSLGFFAVASADDELEVRLTTLVEPGRFVDGTVSAGAVMLVDRWELASPAASPARLEIDPESGAIRLLTKAGERREFSADTGLLKSRKDRNGNRTAYRYVDADRDGRSDELDSITRQGGLVTRFRYTAGKLVSITDFAGRVTRWSIVGGLVQSVTAPAPGSGMTTPRYRFRYAPDGLLTQMNNPRGYLTRIARDVRTQRVTCVINPDNCNWSIGGYLVDGSDGTLRLPASAHIGALSVACAGLVEPRATYVDPRGNVWEYQTDRFGLLTAEARPAVPGSPQKDVWRWMRDERGLPRVMVEPPGGGGDLPLPAIRTRQFFNAAGDLVRRIFADGTYEEWYYEPVFHQVRDHSDRLGHRTGYVRDACGNVVLQKEYAMQYDGTPDRYTRYTYSAPPTNINALPGGLLTRVVIAADSPAAVTTVQEYYTSGRQVGLVRAIRTAVGAADPDVTGTTVLTYDQRRNLITRTDPLGRVTRFTYDVLGRLIMRQDPSPETGDHAAPVTTYLYDAAGNVTLTVDPAGVRTLQAYDALNRLYISRTIGSDGTSSTSQTELITRYGYDASGNLIRQTDPLNRRIEYVYDARNQNTAIKHSGPRPTGLPAPPESVAGQAATFYDYDTLGNLRSVTDASGATTSYAYDRWGRMIRETAPAPGTGQHAAPVSHHVYDAVGHLVEVRESGVNGWRVTSYTWDSLGRLIREVQPADQTGRRLETGYTYDARDNVLTETRPDRLTVEYQYDLQDRVCRITSPDPDGAAPLGRQIIARQYNLDGTLRTEQQWNAAEPAAVLVTSYSYDQLGRLTRVTQMDPDGCGPLVAPETTYHYDVVGNQVQECQHLDQGRVLVRKTSYDGLSRPWKTVESTVGNAVREEITTYDRGGQVVQRQVGVGDGTATVVYRQTDYAYDELGRLVMQADPLPTAEATRPVTYYYYDAVGNLRFVRDPAGCWTEYEFDRLGRLVMVAKPAVEGMGTAVTRFEYAVTGAVTSVVDPLGRRTSYVRDDFGRELLRRLPSIGGQVPEVRTDYDVMGNVIGRYTSDGHVTLVAYDAFRRLVSVMEDGVKRRYTYDPLGRLASETDVAGRSTHYGYDLLGRQTSVQRPSPAGEEPFSQTRDDRQAELVGDWQVVPGGFEQSQQVAAAEAANPVRATWSFTGLTAGRTYEVLATWEPDPGHAPDVAFQICDSTGPLAPPVVVDQQQIAADVLAGHRAWQRLAVVTVASDTLSVQLAPGAGSGNVVADAVRVIELCGTTYTTYDLAGNIVSQTDGLGHTTRYTYDEQSHQTSITDANGDTTRFTYDPWGRLAAVVDPLGNATTYGYDALDRLTQECVEWQGDSYTTSYQYDVRGQLQRVVDRLGRTRLFHYDALGQLREEIWYENAADAAGDVDRVNTIAHSYDLAGRLVAVRDGTSIYSFTYDVLDREVAVIADLPGTPAVVLATDYEGHDQRPSRVTAWVGAAQDFETRFTYDAHGWLRRLEQTGPGVADKRVDFRYTPAGQFARCERYEGLLGDQLVAASVYTYDGQGRMTGLMHQREDSQLAGYQWVLDPAGRVAQCVSVRDGVATYQYDARGQLLHADYTSQPDESYAYDANGNRVADGSTVGARNQLESDGTYCYAYDAQGNRIKRTEIATGAVTEYRWDLLNRLVEITERARDGAVVRTIQYAYDVFGRRVGKTVAPAVGPSTTESYVYDGAQMVLRFEHGQLTNRYLPGPVVDQVLADEQVGDAADGTAVWWPLADNLGTVRDVVRYDPACQSAEVVKHVVYDAFGNVVDQTGEAVDYIFGFTGREDDAESDLNYYRARYYDPGRGQFISEDPSGLSAGDANLYRYVKNSPTNKIDPTGCYDEDVHFYFNYYLARYLGLDQSSGWGNSRGQPMSEALIIAQFATRVDYDAQTKPLGAGIQARSRFHMPDPDDGMGVRMNDGRVYKAMCEVADAGDLEMFGVLLHVYQDTFAHFSYGDAIGHIRAPGGVHSPDEPFRDSARERWMAFCVYSQMVRLLMARRGIDKDDVQAQTAVLNGRSFKDFWSRVSPTLLIAPTTPDAEAFRDDRVAAWQELIARDFRGATPRFNDKSSAATNYMTRWQRRVAAKVPVWYSPKYDHHAHWGHWRAVPRQPSNWSTIKDSLRCSWNTHHADPSRNTRPQSGAARDKWPWTYGGLKW